MLGADILDSTNQNAFKFGSLEEQDTWFELSYNQRKYFDSMRHINSYLREEFHAIHVNQLFNLKDDNIQVFLFYHFYFY